VGNELVIGISEPYPSFRTQQQ